jgi:hypothetical protein
MELFIKVQVTDEYDDVVLEFIEEANSVSAISSVIESELIDDLIVGQSVKLTVVEMTEDEVANFNEANGY